MPHCLSPRRTPAQARVGKGGDLTLNFSPVELDFLNFSPVELD